jgi:hypothetical protein
MNVLFNILKNIWSSPAKLGVMVHHQRTHDMFVTSDLGVIFKVSFAKTVSAQYLNKYLT